MTATLHKVFAGTGYLYYLRQVAVGDSSDLGADPLADYYSAHGESPGRWHGSGLAALGIEPGEEVTEAQMRALFGEGRHPNADHIEAAVIDAEIAAGAKRKDAQRAADKATRLGNPYRVYSGENEFRNRCADAFARHNIAHGYDKSAAISDDIRARIRTDVATGMFREQYKRAPLDTRELSGWVARISRPRSAAVAGIDITFSPVKSVSALWAIAPKHVADRIAAAHDAAVDDALAWLERHGTYTRLGRNGVRQVEVEGVVAARFTHRESRCGDPDLHTHALLANICRTLDGRWRTLDASMIYRLLVTVSEIYNTRLEQHLEADVGLEFAERPGTDPAKRPIREIVGVPVALIEFWSRRDAAIRARLTDLAAAFQKRIGREPTPKEMFGLADHATLATRPAKHSSRSWAQQRSEWRAQATAVLGGRKALADAVARALRPPPRARPVIDAAWIARTARAVLATVSAQRATWQRHHIRSETERHLRGAVPRDRWEQVADAVVTEALAPAQSIARGDPDIAAEPVLREVPPVFRRTSGTSVHTVAGAQTYTSPHRLQVATRLIDLSLQQGARTIPDRYVAEAIRAYNADPANADRQLNAGQAAVVTSFASSPWRIETANAPAGSGKTTAMRVLVDAWHASGGTVVGFTPTAAAAKVLHDATGARVETVDKLLSVLDAHTPGTARHSHDPGTGAGPSLPQWMLQLDADTLAIVDEHVQLGDDKRLRLFDFLAGRDATIRCVGDTQQLSSIEAGGTAAETADAQRASTLTQVVRFTDRAEAAASLLIRDGDPAGLGYYLDHQRIRAGAHGAVHDDAYTAWIADYTDGRDAIMLAATHDLVRELNDRARLDRLSRTASDHDPGPQTPLADGLEASPGDIVTTRHNDPKLRLGDDDWVRNGYRWIVEAVHPDGSLTATHLRPGRRLGRTTRLPAAYVGAHVRLGYAATINSAQGVTADTCHIVLTGHESRNQLYVALTRGADANHLYLPTALDGSEASYWTEPAVLPKTAVEVLHHILARDAAQISAHTELRDALDPHRRLGRALDIYLDATGLATEHTLGTDALASLDDAAEQLRPGLTDAPAYPVLRQHLATLALTGHDPITRLRTAATARELDTADDPAAVLDWRLDPSGAHSTSTGPLPWIPGLPRQLPDDPVTEHLRARARLVADLAAKIATDTGTWTMSSAPVWARPLLGAPHLVADLAVWRAAHHVPDTDTRPTGPARYPVRDREHQQLLDARVTDTVGDLHTAVHTWSPLAKRVEARLLTDPWWPVLADRLDTAATAGLDIDTLLTRAAALRPLPDDMPAAALWFRLGLDPSALATDARTLQPDWSTHLRQLLGDDITDHVTASPAWPRLVAAVDHATRSGWTTDDAISTAHELLTAAHPDPTTPPRPDQYATALAWRIEALLHPTTDSETPTPTTTMDTTEPTTHHTEFPDEADRDIEPAVPERFRAIGDLLQHGRLRDAAAALRRLDRELDADERDILERVAATLYHHAWPVAKARLQWAAHRYPHHRALIDACTPTEDPGVYQPDFVGARVPADRRDRRRQAARDHEIRIDPALRGTRHTPDVGGDFADTYLTDRAGIDADPHHLPIPDGVDHHYHTASPAGTSDGYATDYDRAAVPNHHGFACTHCGIERATLDTQPRPGHRSDDGLCGDCRDDGQPAIPDHDPADHITARATHITTTYPPDQARAKLRRDWRDAPTRRARHTLTDWVRTHPFPHTDTDTSAATFDPRDPIQALTDHQLAQYIDDTHRRIALHANEDTLFGPAPTPARTDDEPQPTAHRGWLRNELADLHAEHDRRTRLTPDQAHTEHTLRARHHHDTDTPADRAPENTPRNDPGPEL
ncbi:conjugative relaxase-like TrwC/TraI family protein [Nocardia transvalensis]|uniref:Conjugative relaxase-like TrwC/TraI family protein n=1 Tax=Nocardia transvalensis TaxID=37333 RepID=A0A7W9PJK4_9NOCA|nr:MobF family relaxase [Nocardia transvalensis]MBB5916784.1 conjugative relaxase-like TrwC/TraI family protein [Nocardia transvalensis]